MVQGTKKIGKPLGSKSALGARTKSTRTPNNAGVIRRGLRTYAPKRPNLIKSDKLAKKVTAQLTAGTEHQLAEKAGHLELLAGGKKEKKAKEAAKAAKVGK